MKLAGKSVAPFLAKPEQPYRAVLFYGPDNGLVRERTQIITKQLIEDNAAARLELTNARLAADPPLLADELCAIDMMAPKRVIIVRDADDKLIKIIENAASFFNDSTYLIVCAGELTARSALRIWFEKHSLCVAIGCYHDEAFDLQKHIKAKFDAAHIQVNRETVDFLSQQLGNDRFATNQELEKLITFAGADEHLTFEHAQSLVDYNRDAHCDDAVNALANRDLAHLQKELSLHTREGTSPVTYLRAMQRYFSRLYDLHSRMNAGKSVDEVIQSIRPPVFFRQIPILQRHLQQWNIGQLSKAISLLVQAELACKTSDMPALSTSGRALFQIAHMR